MKSRSSIYVLPAAVGMLLVLAPVSRARADDQPALTVGVAVGANLSAGQAVPEGYDNTIGDDPSSDEVPALGFGGGAALVLRRPLSERSQLRFGTRLGYGQGRALFDLSESCPGGVAPEDEPRCVEQGALRGSAAFATAQFGGEVHLGAPDATRPYLLGELGFGLAQLWPRARADENNWLTCSVSTACPDPSGEPPSGPETSRLAVGPAAVVGAGLALPSVPLRVEASYIWHSLLGGAWRINGESPGTTLSMAELSVGYVFGGG